LLNAPRIWRRGVIQPQYAPKSALIAPKSAPKRLERPYAFSRNHALKKRSTEVGALGCFRYVRELRLVLCSPVSAREIHVALREVHDSTVEYTWHHLKPSPIALVKFNAQLGFSGENAHSTKCYKVHSMLENPRSMGDIAEANEKTP